MKRVIAYFIFLVTVCVQALANDVQFVATAPNTVAVGQQFRLEFNIKNAKPNDFKAPEFEGFDVLMGPSISTGKQVSIINGSMTSTENVAYTYVLAAKQEGTFTISPARFTLNGKTTMSNAVTIRVVAQSAVQQNNNNNNRSQAATTTTTGVGEKDIICVVSYNKKKAYVNEPILATVKLYHKGNVSGIESAKFPEYKGFVSQEVNLKDEERSSTEEYNGEKYYCYIIKQDYLFPQRPGTIEMDPGEITVSAKVQRRTTSRPRSIFDMDDFFNTTTLVRKDLKIKGSNIEVVALPTNGKPSNFSGAVGSYKMETSINSTDVKANDPINVKVKISGAGNIKYVTMPEMTFPNDFEVYDPKVDVKTHNAKSGITGSKEAEYLIIPRYAGDYEIPSKEFSYFDPSVKQYKTLHTQAYTVHVEKGESSSTEGPVVSNFGTKENVKYLGKDIRFINTKDTSVKAVTKPFFGSTAFVLWFIIPLGIFTTLFILYRKQLRENANITLVKNKRANKQARKRLKKAEEHLKANNKEHFYEEILKALWGYTSDKLNIPVSELNKDNIDVQLTEHGVSDEVEKEFMDVLQTCEFARFAPTGGHEAMDTLYNKAVELISTLEEQIKK